jgi:drug/metabolite transporter (DMT)-like permease
MLFVSTDSLFVRLGEGSGATMAFLMACGSTLTLGTTALARRDGWATVRQSCTSSVGAVLLIALLGAATQFAFIVAVTQTSVANVVVIVGASPIAAAIAAFLILRERPERRVLWAIVVTAVGIGATMSGSIGSPSLQGDLVAIIAICAWSLSIVVWRKHPHIDRASALAASSVVMAIATAPLVDWGSIDVRMLLAGGAMGLIANPAGRMLYSAAPRYVPTAEVALFAPVETVAATIWAWLAFAEVPATQTVIGGIIVLGAIALATWPTSGSSDTAKAS